jgi:hypothetical protein
MAKSNLSRKRTERPQKSKGSDEITTLFKKDGYASTASVDMADFFHSECDPAKPRIKDRATYVSSFIRNIDRRRKAKENENTLYNEIIELQVYLTCCDRSNVSAFSLEGLTCFRAALDEQGRLYDKRKRFLFQHEDGDSLGLKASTIYMKWAAIVGVVDSCGFPAARLTADFPMLKRGDTDSFTALSDAERDLFLRRSQHYFFDLAAQLLAHKGSEPPNILTVAVDGVQIEVGGNFIPNPGEDSVEAGAPINQALAVGYDLLAFYTSFNDTQLCELTRDLELDESRTKTNHKYYNLRQRKGRKNGAVVDAEVGGHIEKSGRRFLKILIELSEKYDTYDSGRLFYMRSVKGNCKRFYRGKFQAMMSDLLFLTDDNSHLVADHLVDQFLNIVDNKRRLDCSTNSSGVLGCRTVQKKWRKITQPQKIAPDIGFCAAHAIAGIGEEMKGMLCGLEYKPQDDGVMDVYYKKSDGSSGCFSCGTKYRPFFERLESYSAQLCDGAHTKNHYLVAFGAKNSANGVHQWEGFSPKGLWRPLAHIGIASGDFLLSVNSSRLRETGARAIRNDGGTEDEIALILNNSLATVMKHYSEGNKEESQLVLQEALEVLRRIASGEDRETAANNVTEALGIPCLTFKQASRQKGRINSAGFFCTSKEKPSSHFVSARRAGKLGIDPDKMPCFQYQKCIGCKSAKLVEDEDALYRSLSNAEAIARGAEYYPEDYDRLIADSQTIKLAIAKNVSRDLAEKVMARIVNVGLHPLYQDVVAVAGLRVGGS